MSDDLSIDDLLGGAPDDDEDEASPSAKTASTKRRGKSPRAPTVAVVQTLLQPVSITFLADVLQRDKKTVAKRLAGLAPMGHHRGNIPLYDFRQALEYLVTPRFNAAEAIKKMGTDDLPLGLQKDVWDARLKQQKWMLQAGDLWKTEDVLEVLGETFQRLKTTTQLWIDQLSEGHSLPAEVRTELSRMVDGLQTDLHRSLVEMPKERATRAQLAEIEGSDLDV
ncbi:putative terminase small subunit [Ruegeria phage vB_RpoS-V16]|uniref:terminase small subunit n=1 Tax=Ruegeria phage vB_RpoS-V16 TaxID=2218618 RepID=UPI000DCAD4C8|nr:terminase small subunit [Ruegeria phage vB_RpoS-V16]AWY09501.1 putative terminase small subunit [Ruegeria phage vB_RpoS-V16]